MTSHQERKCGIVYVSSMEGNNFGSLELDDESSSFDEDEEDSESDSETYEDSGAIILEGATGTIEPYQFEPLHGSSLDETSESEGTDEMTNDSARLENHDW